MDIKNITVRYCSTGKFDRKSNDGLKHIKELPYLSVVQATEGCYSFGLSGQKPQKINCGECFIAPALARQEITHHADKITGTMSARWVFMDVLINDNIPFDLVFSLPVFPDTELCKSIGNILDRIFSTDSIIDQKIHCYELLKLLLPFSAEKQARDARIDAAVYYINKHFKKHLTVKEVAEVCNMSEPNLYRLFKQLMGTSPIDYCNSLKLSHACILLRQNVNSIEEIALVCGFEDPFYFSKIFKKKMGMTPTMYRKKFSNL